MSHDPSRQEAVQDSMLPPVRRMEADLTAVLLRLDAEAGTALRIGPPPGGASRGGEEVLGRLQRRFLELTVYENLDIVLGRPPGITPAESLARIRAGRGGYCYQLNGAFAALLESLGFAVTRHVGGVHGRSGSPHINGNHMALTVATDGERWLVDVGLADGPAEPIPLRAGRYRQGPFEYELAPSTITDGGWAFRHDPCGTFAGMDFAAAAITVDDLLPMHVRLSTAPGSPFVQTLCVGRRHRDGVDMLRSLTLTSTGEKVTRTVLQNQTDWWAVLGDVFRISASAWPQDDRDRLWRIALRQHEAFQASRAVQSDKDSSPVPGPRPGTGR